MDPTKNDRSGADGDGGLEPDGLWCPMAHCNAADDSFANISPLRSLNSVQSLDDPVIAPEALINLGAYTGKEMAVCAYESPNHPALVAFNYQDGSVKWASPHEDLPPLLGQPGPVPRRWVAGILMAKTSSARNVTRRYVFAGNSHEYVAYSGDGVRLWKRPSSAVTPEAPGGVSTPRDVRLTADQKLVTATHGGWVVKLDPWTGETIDACKMDATVVVRGQHYRGIFVAAKSTVLIGNVLYLVVHFKPEIDSSLPVAFRPVHVVRIALDHADGRKGAPGIKPLIESGHPRRDMPDRLAIGTYRSDGSPSGLVTADGKVLIFANSYTLVDGKVRPVVTAVEDDHGVLRMRWQSILDARPGERVCGAPALHGKTRTLFVGTRGALHVFRNIDEMVGWVTPPLPIPCATLLDPGMNRYVSNAKLSAPFALALDRDAGEIVAYTNFHLTPNQNDEVYGFLAAFSIPVGRDGEPSPLWCQPLALTEMGAPAPGPGTYGQPALFEFEGANGLSTGLIVNTCRTGSYIFR